MVAPDPKNYDFTNTDHLLKKWHDAGTQIFFRFGEYSEDQPRKHFVLPVKDGALELTLEPNAFAVLELP